MRLISETIIMRFWGFIMAENRDNAFIMSENLLIMRLIMNLIMRVLGHYEPLENPNLIMIVSLIRRIMRLLVFQCATLTRRAPAANATRDAQRATWHRPALPCHDDIRHSQRHS